MFFSFIVDIELNFLTGGYLISIFFKKCQFKKQLIAVHNFKQHIGR